MNNYLQLISLVPLLLSDHSLALALLVPGTIFAAADLIRAIKSDGKGDKEA